VVGLPVNRDGAGPRTIAARWASLRWLEAGGGGRGRQHPARPSARRSCSLFSGRKVLQAHERAGW
jgi:hypothetical protein